MTNHISITSTEGSRKGFSRRQRLFYTAITQFSMKTTLELEKKKTQPHVISHYTAGARLEGLTDRQLARQMKRLQRTAVHHDSPYAKPLPFVSQINCSVVMVRRSIVYNIDLCTILKFVYRLGDINNIPLERG